MCALDLLCVPLARLVLVGIEMPCICAPIVGVIARDTKRLEQRFALQKHLILPPATDIRQHLACVVMLGRRKARYLAARFLTPPV